MPIIMQQPYAAPSRLGTGAAINPIQASNGTDYVVKQDRNAFGVIAGVGAAGVLDLADTVLSSTPGLSSGFERGDLNRAFLRATDMPGLNDFWNDYRGGIEATSGVYGIVAAELATRKLTAPASAFMGALSKVPYVRRIATLDRQYDEALKTVRLIDANLASRGALGAEQYVGRAFVDTAKFDPITGAFVTVNKEISRKAGYWNARGLGFLQSGRNIALTEATMGLTLNQNGFLYDDSAAHNLAWMAGGAVLGATAESFHAVYQMRKFVNSDEVRRTFAHALDPGGQEESRLLWHGKKVPKGLVDEGFLGGVFTDRATNLFVNARILTDKLEATGMLESNRSQLATQHTQQAMEELQKVTTKGISTDGRTRLSVDAPEYGNHVQMLSHDDPAWAYGVEQVGGVTEDITPGRLHDAHMNRLQERIEEAEERLGSFLDDEGNLKEGVEPKDVQDLQDLARRLEAETRLTPMVAIDGELMPLSEAEAFAGFKEPEIGFTKGERVDGAVKGTVAGDSHGLWEIKSENPKGNITLGTDFLYHIPGGKKLAAAGTDHYDIMRLYRLGGRAVEQMSKFRGQLMLPKSPDWFQLDMAEEILRRTNGRAQIMFPDGMTRDSARVEALLQKSKALKEWDSFELKKALKAESAGNTYEGQLSKLRLRFNLPRMSSYERGILGDQADHPVESLLRGMAQLSEAEIKGMSLTEIRKSMAEFKRVGDMAPVTSIDVEDLGKSFAFLKDSKGHSIRPLMIYKRPFKVQEWTTEHVAERLAAAKIYTSQRLTEKAAAPMTRGISESILSSPDFNEAAKTHELLDTQIQGAISGSSPQTAAGAFGKAFTTSDWRDRDNPILLAATRLRESVNRMARDHMKSAIEGAFEGRLALLANPRNAASKLLLNNFHSFRSGWDIAKKPHSRRDGFYSFILEDTMDNRDRFLRQYGQEMKENQALLDSNGKEIVLDSLGMDIQRRFNAVTELIRNEKNTLLRANGRGEIQHLYHYVPPGNLQGKYIGLTFGPDGKSVPGLGVVAKTEQEFAKAQEEVLKKIEKLGLGYTFRTQESVKQYANIWDKAQMDFIDPGVTAVQPNKRQRGALAGLVLKTDAFEESLKYIQDGFLEHSSDIMETLFREQINAAKARALVSSEMTKNTVSRGYSAESRNIYDFYLENLLGKSKLNSKGSFFGRFYKTIEGHLDKFLAEATPGVSSVWHATNEWTDKHFPWSKDAQAKKDFDALSEKLGKYMPFQSAAQMIERQGLGASPFTTEKFTSGFNKFSAAVLLRMFEVAHPLMNLSGILNASPAVVRSLQPRTGETVEEFSRRIGHASNIFQLNPESHVGVLDMTKLAGRAFKRAWSRSSHADYEYMVSRGFLSQEVAEFQRQFGAIDTPGKWQRFFMGDPSQPSRLNIPLPIKGGGTHMTQAASKGVVGWTSTLSDKSEDFSRSWGHMVGLELADVLGITSREARHAFAHDVANKMIANYSPHNRPEIFQGALGAPIGLFQSFMINYYERMFRYVETKDYKSLVSQMASQAGLFGVTSLPGWQQFNSAFSHASEGESDPESGIWRKFGGNAGDLIGHGVLSNIPKLFGGPAVDLYSRGDVSVRQLQIQDVDSISGILNSTVPAVNVAGKLYAGLIQGAKMFKESITNRNIDMSGQQFAEVFSNMLANRPLSGMIEQVAADGLDVDKYGQLVSETTGAMESAYRLLGLRSMRQSEELRAFYANKNAMSHKAANDEQLRLYTRATIRAGNMDALPGIFNQYMENGGDPRHFRRWLKMSYIAATETRGSRQLEQVMKNPEQMDQVLRLLDAGVTIDEDTATQQEDLLYVATPDQEPLTQQPAM